MRFNLADAQQQALGFLVAQTAYIEPQVVTTKYPDVLYPTLIPVDTSAPEWAKSVTFYSSDQFGQADWFNHLARDIPLADVSREKFEQGIEMAAIGYFYTLEELGQAMMIRGMNLSTDRAAAARRAYEEFVDAVAFRGNTAKGLKGLINYTGVTVIDVAADGTGTSSFWADKTADLILRDVNDALMGVYSNSQTVEFADTLLIPLNAISALGKIIPNSSMTVMQWLLDNNVLTMTTGQKLTIRAIRGLDDAGADGGGRIVAYRKDPTVLKLHIPMPHRFLPPVTWNGVKFDVPGIFRVGGLEIRRPGAVRYIDGITDVPYPG